MADRRDEIGMSPEADRRRVQAVRDLLLLDTPPEERFDRVVRLARELFGVPTVGINLVDADRQFTKAAVGALPLGDMPRPHSLCTFAVQHEDTLEITDAGADPRWADHPAVAGDLGVRFYAGAPLHGPGGERVGALCLIDEQPRSLTDRERRLLRDLADWVERELATTADLEQGRELQRRLLPRRMPDLPGWQVAGTCVQAGAVGGDFFDVQELGGQVQLLLADVMGKGLSAALIAAGVRAIARGTSPYNNLETTVGRVAGDLGEDLDEAGSFVTMFACRFDPGTGDVQYVDAGHGLAFVLDAEGGWRHLRSDGLPLGALPDDAWHAASDRVGPGESLVIVSDGLLDLHSDVEAMAQDVAKVLGVHADARDAVEALAHEGGSRVEDDVTVIVARRAGRA